MESGIDEEWEMVDFKDEDKSQVRWRWLIDAGKKVVIGGLLLSSLPFILPPLVVISALALALSVPYGVVLASYACTHNLMSKLLPQHEDINQIGDDQIRREEEEEEEEEEGYNLEINKDDDDDDVERVNEEEEGDTKPYFDVVKTKQEEEEEENLLQEKIITETKGGGGGGGGEVNHKQTDILVQDNIITKDEKQNKRTKNQIYGNRKEAPLNLQESLILVEHQPNVDQVMDEKIQHDSVKSTADPKGTEEEKHIAPEDQEEAFGDDKIWAKIDAIREISGFNAPRRDSYYQELKALYLFTGIEAPSTTPPDFPHFYSNLCLLMSVIGLK